LLNNCTNRDVFFTSQWFNCWINSFLLDEKILLVTANSSDRLHAILPLMLSSYKKGSLQFNIIKSMTNKHSLRFDYLSDSPSPGQFAELLKRAFAETKSSMILLENVSEKSFIMKDLDEACKIAKCKYLVRQQWENCLIKIENSFEEYFNTYLTSKFRKNVRAAERKALKRGTIKLLQPKTSDELENFLERIFNIEKLSWKGKSNTLNGLSNADQNFIRDLSYKYMKSGWLHMSLIQNGDDDLAYFYCIGNYGILRGMRLAMADQFRNIGPGMINIKYFLEKTFEEKNFHLLDFGGEWARYKNDWTNERENIFKVFIYRNNILGNILFKMGSSYNRRYPYQSKEK